MQAYEGVASKALDRLSFTMKDMSLTLSDVKPASSLKTLLGMVRGEKPPDSNQPLLLQTMTGTIRAGASTAIMGPSGAGKTIFLDVLMGRRPKSSGTLHVLGKAMDSMQSIRKVLGFVPQDDDVMLAEMTVTEVLRHAAQCRLPMTWTRAQCNEVVECVLDLLDLRHVADQFIGDEQQRGISGGQKKRVNIGMELVALPLAIFLDEPTR